MSTNERNTHGVFVTLGASNHSKSERHPDDYYATDPKALELLLDLETFSQDVWEPACGGGHLSKVLESRGYHVRSTDLNDWGYGESGIDFLHTEESYNGDIITNPPYKNALAFVKHALHTVKSGHKVAMFLRLNFLEGKSRRELFECYPPLIIYVSSSRIGCCKSGDFSKEQLAANSAQAYAWFIWQKGYAGDTVVKWFN